MSAAASSLPPALEPLRSARRWVLWKKEIQKGRLTKVPYTSATRRAKSDDANTWRAFDKLAASADTAGTGIMLGDGLVGVDMDACITEAGELEPWAAEVLQLLPTYAEVSPSGRGIKLLMRVEGDAGRSASVQWGPQVDVGATSMERKRRELALFTGGRFFTITGNVYGQHPVAAIPAAALGQLRERIKGIRANKGPQREREGRPTPPVESAQPGADSGRLPAGLLRLVRDGAPEGERSEQFHHAVRWAADCGMPAARIVALLEQHPEGIGAKYADRLAAEVERSLQGYAPKVARVSDRGHSAARPAAARGAGDETASLGRGADSVQGGTAEPADFADPVAAAASIVATMYTAAGLRVLHYWQAEFHWWARSHYVMLPMADVREVLYRVGPAVSAKPIKKRIVDDVLDALKAAANLSHRVVPAVPAWIDRRAGDPDPRAVIPVRNGLVHVDTGQLLEPTPRLFVPYALPFDYTPDAAPPLAWFAFLASLWRDDRESIDALQEWLGYLLTADTSLQKALMIVGPRRSGKGTIGRVVVQLLGERNVASPTLASLGNNFGLEPLIGKTAALMSDARLGARADVAAVAENVLRLTGEDAISVDRKFREAYTAKLLARIVVLANEVPVFRDAASALPGRFIVLRTDKSFFGHEDHGLDRKLAAELPGILVWALDGLRRLRGRGRFVQPASAAAQMRLMEELASPISMFLRDKCLVEPGAQVPVGKLYEAWREWCREHGRDKRGTEQTFGRDIAAAVPGVGHSRPRVNGERVRMYEGIRLRAPDDRVEDDDDAAE